MLTPAQTAVLQHLVQVEPTSQNARDVSRQLGLDLPAALRCLHALREGGYACYLSESAPVSAGPEDAEHVPTVAGKAYLTTTPL